MPKLISSDEPADFEMLEGTAEDVTKLEKDNETELNSILSNLDGDDKDVRFEVSMQRIREGKYFKLFNCSVSDLDKITDRLRDEYGSGEYRALIYRNKKLFRKLTFLIEAPKVSPPKMENDLVGVFHAFMGQLQKQNEQIQAILTRPNTPMLPPPIIDPNEGMNRALEMMIKMKTLMPDAAPQSNNMDMFLRGLEMAKEFGGNEGGSAGFMDIAKEFIKQLPIADIVKSQINAPKMTQSIPAPTNRPQNNQPIGNNSDMSKNTLIETALKNNLEFLISKAKQNKDVALYVELTLDQIPNAYFSNFVEYVNQPDVLEKLISINKNIEPVRGWFTTFIDILRADIKDILADENEDLTPDQDSGSLGTNDDPQPINSDTPRSSGH